ncbi:MarR family winged helix-turn-helix transcriptional regulator [Turicibacter sp. TJ11]|uniref:MarR family winged helix-turn-helix transcriptional regulator n=1 Tax=Turicibacter sp. TJ11 TaxID=2806443 RepID=UPI001F2D96E2|nr:MarR family winged helix-turn-helix transcriptional regulator [Turicibacter sp. TJ11]
MKPNCVGKEIHSVGNLIKRQVDNLSSIRYADQLTGTNGWIIDYLYHHQDQDIFQKDIEEIFEVTRSTASKVITLMEKKGMLTRTTVPHDARLKKLTLTPLALEMEATILNDIQQFEKQLIKGLNEQEINFLFHCLSKIRNNIRSF